MKRWYEIKMASKDRAEVWLYDFIGKDLWSGDGVTAKDFQKELSAIKSQNIDLHINSPGGDVFDGITIYNLLKQHDAMVTTYIDGLAASIASVIALAGDKVYAASNGIFMIHNPWGFTIGDANDMRKTADVLDKIRGTMLTTYSGKTGKAEDEIIPLLDAESWMDAREAKEFGFIDEVTEKMDLAACAKFVPALEKMGLKNIPKEIRGDGGMPSKRDLERLLIEQGKCSQKLAKSILAGGYKPDQRDVDPTDVSDPPPGQDQRDVDPAGQRDVVQPKKRGTTSDLLVRNAIIIGTNI